MWVSLKKRTPRSDDSAGNGEFDQGKDPGGGHVAGTLDAEAAARDVYRQARPEGHSNGDAGQERGETPAHG
jgi:hypothetical protein